MSVPEDPTPSTVSTSLPWFVTGAAFAIMVCICAAAAVAILMSAGAFTYAGISRQAGEPLQQVTQVVLETLAPPPTYTFQPTYTSFPTYTLAPTPSSPGLDLSTSTLAAPIIPPTMTSTFPPPDFDVTPATAAPNEDIDHTVVAGDTLASIAQQYGSDIVALIYVNGLDPADPQIAPDDIITVPARLQEWCVPANNPTQAEVISVIDGNTIEVLIGGQNFRVRYVGVDAPNTGPGAEPFSAESLAANAELVEGETVLLVEDISNADDLGELPRYVMVGNTFVNFELARRGFVEAISTEPDIACDELLTLAADQAQRERLGIWAGDSGLQPTTQSTQLSQVHPFDTPTLPASGWTPPPTLSPTSTSSLGFTCHCWGSRVWGNFVNQAQADACQAICEIAEARRIAACATATAGNAGGLAGCK